MTSEERRLYLRVTVKLMLLALILGLAYTFLTSIRTPSAPEPSRSSFDIGQLSPGGVERLVWDNKRVLVYRRILSQARQRQGLAAYLGDPESRHSEQPGFADNSYRSRDPRVFVALDYGTDLNCQLDPVDAAQGGPEGMLWLGGFKDRCRGSWYDDAGRVYKGQTALRNLTVPDYRIEGHTLILGGD